MSLTNDVRKTLQPFEGNLTFQQWEKLKDIKKLFEEMVAKGLIKQPQYELAPIGTTFTCVDKKIASGV